MKDGGTSDISNVFDAITSLRPYNAALYFVSIVLVIIVLSGYKNLWFRFAFPHKWLSRIALFLILFFFLSPLNGIGQAVSLTLPRGISPEFPTLTATAIKLGLMGIMLNKELKTQIPAAQHSLQKCVVVLSRAELNELQDKCGEDIKCIETIPVLTRAQIVEKIKAVQKVNVETVSEACKDVDVSKL